MNDTSVVPDIGTYFSLWGSVESSINMAFLRQLKADSVTIKDAYTLSASLLEIVDAAADLIKKQPFPVRVVGISNSQFVIRAGGEDPRLLVIIERSVDKPPSQVSRSHFDVKVIGERVFATQIYEALHERFGRQKLAVVTWWYKNGANLATQRVILDPPKSVHDAFYPWIGEGISQYFRRYLDDAASLLFMLGEAGTGKTSLLRHFIYENGLRATVTYEDELMSSDALFVDFMTSSNQDVLVIEDADLMLSSREHHGNKLIARFLNISDGLIKLDRKKIVFTTNLGDFKEVDPALVRPGRCFDAIRFRALDWDETLAAAEAAGIPAPAERGSYTLAQIFNRGKDSGLGEPSVGFAIR